MMTNTIENTLLGVLFGKDEEPADECKEAIESIAETKTRIIELARKIIYERLFDHLDRYSMDVLAEVLKYAEESNG